MIPAALSGAARKLLALIGGPNGAFIAGDLDEEYLDRLVLTSERQAVLWYWSQILLSLLPLLAARLRRAHAMAAMGGLALGYAVLIAWAVSASAVISTMLPGGIPPDSAALVQIAFVGLEAVGTVLAGAMIGVIALRGTRRIVTAPTVITLIVLILAPAVYFTMAYPDSMPPLIRFTHILSVAPCVTLGAHFGRWVKRRINRNRDTPRR